MVPGATSSGLRAKSRVAAKLPTLGPREEYPATAFTCGLEKVVVPFFDYGVPVEYELVRSLCTVAKKDRKKVGIVRTDAQLFGGFSFAGGRPQQIPKQLIVEELEKQYGAEITAYLKFLNGIRTRALASMPEQSTREKFLKGLASERMLQMLRAKGIQEVKKAALAELDKILNQA